MNEKDRSQDLNLISNTLDLVRNQGAKGGFATAEAASKKDWSAGQGPFWSDSSWSVLISNAVKQLIKAGITKEEAEARLGDITNEKKNAGQIVKDSTLGGKIKKLLG